MEVKQAIQFVHEQEGRVYHFMFPNGFPAQEGIAVVQAVLQTLQKQLDAMQEKEAEKTEQGQEHVS